MVSSKNDLDLLKIYELLLNRKTGIYYQKLGSHNSYVKHEKNPSTQLSQMKLIDGEQWLVTSIIPEPHLLIFGGGVDAIPVVNIAKELGWIVSLVDPRTANARIEKFPTVDYVLRKIDEYSPNMGFDLTLIPEIRPLRLSELD